jgi:serine protease Do
LTFEIKLSQLNAMQFRNLTLSPFVVLVCACLMGLIGGLAGASLLGTQSNESLPWEAPLARPVAPAKYNASGDMSENFVFGANEASPSVVFIKTVSTYRRQDNFWSFWDFGGWGGGQVSSAGSGVIFSRDGYIITNRHVIEGADQIDVVLANKRSLKATIVGSDPNTDLAVLKVSNDNLKPAALANSDEVQIGQWVMAIGNPMNLTSTVTAGIISAKGRNINIVNSNLPIESFLQTDAAINPGNSGGALVNLKGELVGINTAIVSQTGAYSGYGFAIPVNIVKKVAADLIEFGEVQRAFLGAEVTDIDSRIAEQLKNDNLNGVYVQSLTIDGAAKGAGIQVGDILTQVEGHAVNSKAEYMERLSYYRPGRKVRLKVLHEGNAREVELVLTNRDGTAELIKTEIYKAPTIGADIEVLSKAERDKLKIAAGYRLLNLRNGKLRNLGLPEGFIIATVNGKSPETPKALVDMIENTRGRLVIEGIQPGGGRGTFMFYSY